MKKDSSVCSRILPLFSQCRISKGGYSSQDRCHYVKKKKTQNINHLSFCINTKRSDIENYLIKKVTYSSFPETSFSGNTNTLSKAFPSELI